MEKELDDKIIEKALALREEGKTQKEILELFPDDVKELSEILDIVSWVENEKNDFYPDRALLTKTLERCVVIDDSVVVTAPKEARYISREPEKTESMQSAPVDSEILSPFWKGQKIWFSVGAVALVVLVLFIRTSPTKVATITQVPSTETMASKKAVSTFSTQVGEVNVESLIAFVDAEPVDEGVLLSEMDTEDDQTDILDLLDSKDLYNETEL